MSEPRKPGDPAGQHTAALRESYERLLHELGIPNADIEQASERITELRAEARRSAALRERVQELEKRHGSDALVIEARAGEKRALQLVESLRAENDRLFRGVQAIGLSNLALADRLAKADELAAAVETYSDSDLRLHWNEVCVALAAYREGARSGAAE